MTLQTILINVYIFSVIMMLIAFLIEVKIKNAAYVDVFWSFSIGISACYVFYLTNQSLREIIILSCAVLWSFRLTFYLFKRIYFSKKEDTRYKTMRDYFGAKKNIGFFLFFQLQATFVVMFVTPIAIALFTTKKLSVFDFFAVGIFLIAVLGETIADRQLAKFKQENPNSNLVCQKGLWYYSRHPNYFFEWIHWFSYAMFSINSQLFWINLIMPFVMLIFLLKLTGIPHVENEALKNKPGYKNYMEQTSMFIPWFKK